MTETTYANECCADPGNREDGPGPRGADGIGDDVTVTHCTVCQCRHFEVEADPGVIGVVGASL